MLHEFFVNRFICENFKSSQREYDMYRNNPHILGEMKQNTEQCIHMSLKKIFTGFNIRKEENGCLHFKHLNITFCFPKLIQFFFDKEKMFQKTVVSL
jgi:hypothetical protein